MLPLRIAALISSSVMVSGSSMYFSVRSSSSSAAFSRRLCRQISAVSRRLSGISRSSTMAPSSEASKVVGLHQHQIDDAFKGVAGTDGNLQGDGIRTESFAMDLKEKSKSAPILSILLMKQIRGDVVSIGLSPGRFRIVPRHLPCHQRRRRHHQVPAVSVDFDGEVDVPRGIDQVDLVGSAIEVPWAGGCSGTES